MDKYEREMVDLNLFSPVNKNIDPCFSLLQQQIERKWGEGAQSEKKLWPNSVINAREGERKIHFLRKRNHNSRKKKKEWIINCVKKKSRFKRLQNLKKGKKEKVGLKMVEKE